MLTPDTIVAGDCVELMQAGRVPPADLIFADPPFNIGYKYDVYEDRKTYGKYRRWTREWMKECVNCLKPAGSFWIAIGDDYAAEVRLIGRRLGLHLRNWVIWHYTFGQNTKSKFARSHTHLFYFVKNPTDFAFNADAVRTFSDRQRVYKDRRANPNGKVPDDVWTEFPRVCGTFEERQSWHPCQMPETILARIIRACTDPGDLIFDPFAGSGTTLVVAKKLNRQFFGTEISNKYVKKIEARLRQTKALAGVSGERRTPWPEGHRDELRAVYREGCVPTDRLASAPDLLASFVQQLNWRLEASGSNIDGYQPEEVLGELQKLRKAGKLGRIRIHAEERASGEIKESPTLFRQRAKGE